MNNFEIAAKCKAIALHYKTLYVLGGIGFPLTASMKKRCMQQYSYNAKRRKMIEAASADTFGFDCVGLIKSGCFWGWNGDVNAIYGGAKYASNGVPEVGADYMITLCKNVSTDFRKIEIGEAVWKKGHIGVYIGGGLAVECTPTWANKVQITAVKNIGTRKGYESRTWTKHGKLPWTTYLPPGDIDYDGSVTAADARLALRTAVGSEKLTDAQKLAADTDNDGQITAADARNILRGSVGKERI